MLYVQRAVQAVITANEKFTRALPVTGADTLVSGTRGKGRKKFNRKLARPGPFIFNRQLPSH